jgi:hypothetical protein
MRIYIFRSEKKPELNAFAGDERGSMLPANHGPWKVTGVVGTNGVPPHRISRATVEEAINAAGFQLWRMKKPETVS